MSTASMNVAHQLGKITVAIANHRLVAVLKQMPVAALVLVVAHRVPGQQPPHELG